MNKIYFLSLLILSLTVMHSKGQAQINLDFESGGNGASYTWSTFENDDNPAVTIIDNPVTDGINTSSTVAMITARTAGQSYAGTECAHGEFGPLTFTAANSTVKIMVYKTVISDVGVKFAESNGEAQPEVKVANTKINEWEELTFDFSGSIGKGITGVLDQIIIFPDFAERSEDHVVYFDNITFSGNGGTTDITEAAPAPTVAADQVISIFSDSYTNVANSDFDPDWGQSTDATQVDIAGNNTLKLDNLNYQGIVLGSTQDVSAMTSLHLDYWTSDAATFEVSLISTGPLENKSTLSITKGVWVSVDIPLTDFTVPALNDIIQLKFEGSGTVYVDNIYFSGAETTSSGLASIDFENEGTGASYTWSGFENDDNPALTVVDNPGSNDINASSKVAMVTARAAGQTYAGFESAHGDFGPLTFTTANSIVKIMVYKTVISDVGVKFAESNGEAQPEVKVANTKINEWEELTFDFSGSIGKGITGVLDQIIIFPDFAERAEDHVVYFDNITFGAQEETADITEGAPVPTVAADQVISIFSDSYTNVADTDFDPDWGQSTDATQVDVAGNNTLKLDNLNYQGIVLGSSQDVSAMTSLHLDYWTSNAAAFEVSLISTGPLENKSTLSITKGVWVSVDIPLTDFTVPALNDIIQLKFEGSGTVYVDNIYFTSATGSSGLTTGAPTPTVAADQVISIFSDSYTNVADSDLDPDWGQSTDATQVEVAGNNTWKLDNLNYQGIVLGSAQDVSAMTSLHLDYWTSDAESFEVFLISTGPLENGVAMTVTKGAWVSVDIALTDYTVPALDDIIQLKFVGSGTVYVDNIYFEAKEEEIPPASLPIDFEGEAYGFIDFDGGAATVIDNPQSTDDNSSTKVAKMVRNGGALWAGSKLALADNIDFSVNNSFSMKVYSTRADVPVLFKLEGPGAAKELIVNTTVANAWETMIFDFTGTASDTYIDLVFIFDFGTVGDGSEASTFLFDDIEMFDITGGLDHIDLPVNFEGGTVNYSMADFGGNSTTMAVDPDDATNTVAMTTKTSGAATWAGTTVGTHLGFANAIPFTSTETLLNLKVYSPAAGLPVRIKIEDHNDVTLTAEAEVSTTTANAWEVLTFDMSDVATGTNPFNLATSFDKLSVFFNFGVEGTDQVFYWDDVFFGEASVVVEPTLALAEEHNLLVYANEGQLFIKAEKALINSKVAVYNVMGRKVKEIVLGAQETVLDMNTRGVMIVRISGVSGNVSRKVFLK